MPSNCRWRILYENDSRSTQFIIIYVNYTIRFVKLCWMPRETTERRTKARKRRHIAKPVARRHRSMERWEQRRIGHCVGGGSKWSMDALQRRVRLVLIQVRSAIAVQESTTALFVVVRVSVLGPEKIGKSTHTHVSRHRRETISSFFFFFLLYAIARNSGVAK